MTTHRRSKGDRAQGTLPQALYDELIDLIVERLNA